VINGFVPLLWFVKGHRGDRQNYVRDVVINGGKPEKLWHPWQQPLATAEHFIGALTSASGCGGRLHGRCRHDDCGCPRPWPKVAGIRERPERGGEYARAAAS
jgi:hypothetical protein